MCLIILYSPIMGSVTTCAIFFSFLLLRLQNVNLFPHINKKRAEKVGCRK